MPRKKASVIANTAAPPSDVSKAIAGKLNDLPPAIYGALAQTPDQAAMWRQSKHFFKCVGAVIDAHSSGNVLPRYAEMPKAEREAIDNEAWRFISFYNMASFNWQAIAKELSNKAAAKIPPIKSGEWEAAIALTDPADIETPMQLLIEVMRFRAMAQMHNAFCESSEGIPYRLRTNLETLRKARRSDASQILKDKALSIVRDGLKEEPWALLEAIVVGAAIASKPKKHTAQAKALSAYLAALRSEESLCAKAMHKENRPQRVVWKGGEQVY